MSYVIARPPDRSKAIRDVRVHDTVAGDPLEELRPRRDLALLLEVAPACGGLEEPPREQQRRLGSARAKEWFYLSDTPIDLAPRDDLYALTGGNGGQHHVEMTPRLTPYPR